MFPRATSPEEDQNLESMVEAHRSGWLQEDAVAALPPSLREERYGVWRAYIGQLWAVARRPVVRFVASFVMASALTMGQYDPSSGEIWINNDSRYAAQAGYVLTHEENHAQLPDRHPDPHENERLNREATYRMTGDHAQLIGYHP